MNANRNDDDEQTSRQHRKVKCWKFNDQYRDIMTKGTRSASVESGISNHNGPWPDDGQSVYTIIYIHLFFSFLLFLLTHTPYTAWAQGGDIKKNQKKEEEKKKS